ncbi:hypothetical protein BofuT4_P160920.1 [Botrytis cinerea T4]|uniref:Uncharacterized protein n=1 Tax=Botryotinia fuckeliana (strain T4) TaxID=999810 RepID=G2YTP3_BOTF4|nr:hypothetical protein BofuT4_P160920.1 [Botrytis cinerea T4]
MGFHFPLLPNPPLNYPPSSHSGCSRSLILSSNHAHFQVPYNQHSAQHPTHQTSLFPSPLPIWIGGVEFRLAILV